MRVTQKQLQKQPSGFTTIQLVITVAVVAVVSAFAAFGIRNARASMRLANDTRQLASFLEKARADSIRRSARTGFESSVQIIDNNTYIVSMGFGGSDLVTTQTFDLSEGVTFASDPMTITFDWRGRPTSGIEAAIALQNFNDISQIDVTGSGDITIGSDRFQDRSIPDVNLNTNMSGDADVAPDPSNINGSTYPTPTPTPDPDATPTPEPKPDENPTPTPEPTPTPKPHGNPNDPTPTPTPTPEPTPDPDDPNACSIVASASTVTIAKNGGSHDITITLIPNRSGTVSASTGATNLKVTPSRLDISEGGSVTFTVTSLDNTRGNFTVTFTTPCGSKNVTVSIVN